LLLDRAAVVRLIMHPSLHILPVGRYAGGRCGTDPTQAKHSHQISALGRRCLGAMRAAMNCAMANRHVIAHLVRETFAEIFPTADLTLLYDVSHNTCKEEAGAVVDAAEQAGLARKVARLRPLVCTRGRRSLTDEEWSASDF